MVISLRGLISLLDFLISTDKSLYLPPGQQNSADKAFRSACQTHNRNCGKDCIGVKNRFNKVRISDNEQWNMNETSRRGFLIW